MTLPRFDYHQPRSFEELFDVWRRYGEDARYLAGGTALMLLMRSQLLHPAALISLSGLPGMHGIAHNDGVVRIGALTTHTEVNRSPIIRSILPMLAESFGHIATRRVRNVATIGGNISHANPHQDPPTSLSAFGASAVVRGPDGERRIVLPELFLDFLTTSLNPAEVVVAVEIPAPARGTKTAFIKFLPRSADDYATVNVAVMLRETAGKIEAPRIVIGSMAPTPIRAREAEQMLEGASYSESLFEKASKAALNGLDPEADFRGSPDYKLRITPVIVRRALNKAWHDEPVAA